MTAGLRLTRGLRHILDLPLALREGLTWFSIRVQKLTQDQLRAVREPPYAGLWRTTGDPQPPRLSGRQSSQSRGVVIDEGNQGERGCGPPQGDEQSDLKCEPQRWVYHFRYRA
jgi:hypothetical protein